MERECMYCNRITGFRKPLRDSSVTHGICLECVKERFPEIYKKMKEKSNCIHEKCYYRENDIVCPYGMKANECVIHWNFLKFEYDMELIRKDLEEN